MESCADHIHWAGGDWTSSRGGEGAHGEAGGGHAHAGAMVYLGDNWPDEYRNHIFMCNLHGNRINHDILERNGSGYVAHHGKDFLFANDPWFRGLALQYGPDGGVFVSDWSDTGECHNYDDVDAADGRIYKVTYGKPKPRARRPGEAERRGAGQAATAQERLVRAPRPAAAAGAGRRPASWTARRCSRRCAKMLAEQTDAPRKLRALWALHVIGGLDEKALTGLLDDADETCAAGRCGCCWRTARRRTAAAAKFAEMARKDKSASVRLALASALQRLPLAQRWPIAEGLAGHAEDANDANLPLMIWYGIEPLVPADPDRAAALLMKAQIPLVRQYIARRIAARAE